jgi:putative MATE family efflux protein
VRDRRLDRDVWAMAWPVVLSLLLTNVVDLADIAMVGRLGQDSVAAVGYAAQYAALVRTVLIAVGVGCVALVSRALGALDPAQGRRMLTGSLVVSFGFAVVAALVVLALPRELLALLDATPHVAEIGVPYFRLSLLAMLATGLSVIFDSAQRAHRDTRTPMLIALVAATVKIALNVLLIFGVLGFPRLELVGAAIATLIAESLALALYLIVARARQAPGRALLPARLDAATMLGTVREVLRVSLPAVGERVVMSAAMLVYFAILSRYGTSAIAAYSIGVRLLGFSWLPGLAFGAAAATLVGQTLGAGDAHGARRAGWRSMWLALYVMAVLGLGCAFLREPLARVFTHDEAIIQQLLPFLLMLAIAQPFMGVHFTLSGALRGSGDTFTPLLGAALGNWVLRVPLAFVAAKLLHWPIEWVWGALVLDHFARSIWYVLAFRGGRWERVFG